MSRDIRVAIFLLKMAYILPFCSDISSRNRQAMPVFSMGKVILCRSISLKAFQGLVDYPKKADIIISLSKTL